MNKPQSHENLRVELGYIRDNLIDAIRHGMQEGVRQGLFIYEELTKVFIDKLVQLGATYDKKRALKEGVDFTGGWDEVEWLHRDIIDFINEAFLQENFDIMRRIIAFPSSLARISLEARDFYTYNKFISIYTYIYNSLNTIKNDRNRKDAFNKCWRYLKDFSTYNLSYYELEQAITAKSVTELEDYAEYILKIFSSMMKTAFERRNIAHLKLLIDRQGKLFNAPPYSNFNYDIRMLEYKLADESENIRDDIEAKLGFKKALKDIYERFLMLKKLSLFGLNAWVVHSYDEDKLSKDDFKTYHEVLATCKTVEELNNIFKEASDDRNEEVFSWHWWELSESDEESVTIRFDSFLNKLYCLKFLEIIASFSEEQIGTIILDVPIYLIEKDNSSFPIIITEITAASDKWDHIIPSFKRDEALKIFAQTRDRRNEESLRHIIRAELDYEIIRQFSNKVADSWKEKAIFRQLFVPKNVGEPPYNQFYLGFNLLESKEFYVANSEIGVGELGEHYGRQLAWIEDADITKKLWESLSVFPNAESSGNDLIAALNKAIEGLKKKGFKKLLIIALNSWISADQIERNEGYDSKRQSYLGFHFRKINVSSIKGKERNSILIIDVDKIAKWLQYKPKRLFETDEKYYGDLCIMIKKIDREYAEEIIGKDETFLRDKEGNARTQEEAIRYLEQKVHLRILEQYKFDIADVNAGVKILLKDLLGSSD